MSARSEAPNDPRPYIRVALDLPMNPKLAAIEDNFHQCGWAYLCSLAYCGQSMTDGHFPVRAVLRMADVDRDQVMALAEQGLWHLPDHDCPDCEQPKLGHAVVHDYLQHQRSAAEVHDLSSKRSSAGRKGAQARWSAPKQPKPPKVEGAPGIPSAMALAIPSAMASAQQELWQNDGNSMAEEKRGEEIKPQTPTGSAVQPSAEAALAVPGLSPTQRSKIITDAYYALEPMCKWVAINGIVHHAIKSKKYADSQILEAMIRLAQEERGVSVETLRVAIAGFAPSFPGTNQSRGAGELSRRDAPPPKRSTSASRAEQALSVADELDREYGHGRYAQGGTQ